MGERRAIELRTATLGELQRRGLSVPGYDRSALLPRVAHVGVGGFHRAHLAVYLHHLAELGSDWGIRGIGLLAGDEAMAEALRAQDHLYTFTRKDSDGSASEIVGAIIDYVWAGDDLDFAADAIADADVRIVSMTITEAGYTDTAANRRTFDTIAAGLERRRAAGRSPVTILSCDNIRGNGAAAMQRTIDACRRRSPDLEAWVTDRCTFPDSMVDRITPATTEADRADLLARFGLDDRWPVVGEVFWQWVMEDEFAAGRPDFAAVGAIFSDDVAAWELYKLRLLNAGHSCIAYVSALAGIAHVDEAMANPSIRSFLERLLLDEAVPTLDEIPGHPREEYVHTILERFSNSAVRDQIARLCIDGSSKFPTFLIPTIEQQIELAGPADRSAFALAAWAHYLATVPVEQQAFDALAEDTRPLALAALDDPARFLDDNPAFSKKVASDERFRSAFVDAHRSIATNGPLTAVASLAGQDAPATRRND